MSRWLLAGFYGVILSLATGSSAFADTVIRVGHLPNLTHPQALIGRETGDFEKNAGAKVEWAAFNAGASAMEALLAGELDLAYVGPSPALNAYVRSKGRVLRVIAGAASGGVALVVRKDAGIRNPADLKGKRVAVPGLGNTQDVALRSWLKAKGLGSSVQVMPVKNPEIFTLFQRKELDAAWVPEPWATRLIQEADGALFVDERDLWPEGKFPATLLVVRADFLAKNRALVKRFVATHIDLTEAIIQKPDEAKRNINAQLAKLMGKPLPAAQLDEAFTRIAATYDPIPGALLKAARQAWELKYLPGAQPPDVAPIFDLSLLNETLRERGKPLVAAAKR
ncbi:MAG: ABC transporter substrate-binding protein [Gammaproteobacteria bacterium]